MEANMYAQSRVLLRERQLVGARGGLEIAYQLRPHSTTLDLSHNPLFGPEGLESLFQAIALMTKSEGISSCALERLVLVDCGLGSSVHNHSLEVLASYIHDLEHLEELALTNNHLLSLPSTFIDAILTHPTLHTLHLSTNPLLGSSSSPQSSPPPIDAFLSSLLRALSSASSTRLKHLSLNEIELGPDSSRYLLPLVSFPYPLLPELASLATSADTFPPPSSPNLPYPLREHGLESLTLNANPLGTPLVYTLFQTLANQNHHLCKLELYGASPDSQVMQNGVTRFTRRNLELKMKTRSGALGVLVAARVLLNATDKSTPNGDISSSSTSFSSLSISSTPSTSSSSSSRSSRSIFPILSLPTEILQPILAFLHPGELSERQVVAVSKWAANKATLAQDHGVPATREPWRKVVDRKERFLKETGCWFWDG